MLYDLLNYEGKADIGSVRSVLVTGGQLNPLHRKRFEEKYNVPILQNYGSTEVGHVAGWSAADFREGRWKPGSTGRVYEGVRVEIRDGHDKSLPPGEAGEICVESRVTVDGYAGISGDDQLLIKDGWIYTGDIGYLDEDKCLFVVGRKRDMIKCGGFQVFPMEIEDVLLKHPLIKDVTVVSVPDERLGEIPKAFVVLKNEPEAGGEEQLKKEIIDYCRDCLAHFKAVRAVEFLDALPRNEAGKVLKAVLAGKGT
jgi:long-chain acyl-CoA synthetase